MVRSEGDGDSGTFRWSVLIGVAHDVHRAYHHYLLPTGRPYSRPNILLHHFRVHHRTLLSARDEVSQGYRWDWGEVSYMQVVPALFPGMELKVHVNKTETSRALDLHATP